MIQKPLEITPKAQELINIALYILDTFGIPLDANPRKLERMAIAFLASGDIKKISDIKNVKNLNEYALVLKLLSL